MEAELSGNKTVALEKVAAAIWPPTSQVMT